MKVYLAVMLTLAAAVLTADWIENTLPCYAPVGGDCKYGSSVASLRALAGRPTCWDIQRSIPKQC